MTDIFLYNTLSRAKEKLTPLDPTNVRLYACGPTVYDRPHIGNARAAVVYDVLFRLLRAVYGEAHVTYARNITDVDDKIIVAARDNGEPIEALTKRITQAYHDDTGALNVLPPSIEPRATQHIPQMVAMIERLIAGGFAYAAEGHVLFEVKKDTHYGQLSRRSMDDMIAGARVEVAPYKKDPADFVLWKPSAKEKGEPGWDSPWGYGRPGWHIECSAMSTKYLGETFDIHGGGADLMFPHHENEIAQSCCANPASKFANIWVHNGFLTVGGEKMSKSLGNFITVRELLEKGVQGEVIRTVFLSTHYRKPLDWTDKAADDAKKALDGFYRILKECHTGESRYPETQEKLDPGLRRDDKVLEALADDMNVPKALAVLHELAGAANKEKDAARKAALAVELRACGNLLGLLQQDTEAWFAGESAGEGAETIQALVDARIAAKKAKNWQEADHIRDALKAQGIVLEDKPDGATLWRRG